MNSDHILENPSFSFHDTAIVMLRTQYMSFELAMALNGAYGLRLSRDEEIDLGGTPHPCLYYYDRCRWLTYVVIARPAQGADPIFNSYDKMLLIRGRDAWKAQQQIYDDVYNRIYGIAHDSIREPDPGNLIEHGQWVQRNIMAKGIEHIDTFCFNPAKGTGTTMRPQGDVGTLFPLETPADPATDRAVGAYLKRLKAFLSDTFDALYYYFSDEEEEDDCLNV